MQPAIADRECLDEEVGLVAPEHSQRVFPGPALEFQYLRSGVDCALGANEQQHRPVESPGTDQKPGLVTRLVRALVRQKFQIIEPKVAALLIRAADHDQFAAGDTSSVRVCGFAVNSVLPGQVCPKPMRSLAVSVQCDFSRRDG